MSVNKLLLVFALASISFGAKIKVKIVDSYAEFPSHDPEAIQWSSKHETWDKDGLLKDTYGCDLDYTYGLSYLNKSKVIADVKEDAASYIAIPEDKVKGLKVSRKTTDAEREARNKCYFLSFPYDDVKFLGYVAYFRDNDEDFYPSYAYNIYKSPSKYYSGYNDGSVRSNDGLIGDIDGTVYRYVREFNHNCHQSGIDSYIEASRYNYGYVSEDCYPNDFSKIPGYDKIRPLNPLEYVNGSAPIIEDKCTGTGKFKRYFKGYSTGFITEGSLETLKKAIIRFGPVYANLQHAKLDATAKSIIGHPGFRVSIYDGDEEGLVIGWNATHLITIIGDGEGGQKLGDIQIKQDDGWYVDYDLTIPLAKQANFDDFYILQARIFGSGISVVRAALSVIAAAVVLPALALFF